jgi:Cu+-exporting ATPase
MTLEPRTAGTEAENPELRDMSRRFWFAPAVTLPLVFLAMSDLLARAQMSRRFSMRGRLLLELALATPVCVWTAWPFYVRAVLSVKNRSLFPRAVRG